ncbi:YcgN family cysteine cluster protein [Pseudoalteromonas sp. YIC-827]|uniref:YcgN family cysteine cluster protein n=1 Tax=Pseudoalteromonas qingdaonensis TaxID=3131913 RepID=A0ABU9MWX7_9GAMM
MVDDKFWQTKTLAQMSDKEWEAICDGCGKCCLNTFIDSEDEDDFSPTDQLRPGEELIFTNIVCQYLDNKSCSCTQYEQRQTLVPSCVKLTKDNIADIFFMPKSCSYRRLQEGRGLASWHPLLNKGKKSKMHAAGISVRNKTVKDSDVPLEEFEDHIAEWPTYDCD